MIGNNIKEFAIETQIIEIIALAMNNEYNSIIQGNHTAKFVFTLCQKRGRFFEK